MSSAAMLVEQIDLHFLEIFSVLGFRLKRKLLENYSLSLCDLNAQASSK